MADKPKPIVGYYLPIEAAEALHRFVMSRPGDETDGKGGPKAFDLVVAIRQSVPMTREPK